MLHDFLSQYRWYRRLKGGMWRLIRLETWGDRPIFWEEWNGKAETGLLEKVIAQECHLSIDHPGAEGIVTVQHVPSEGGGIESKAIPCIAGRTSDGYHTFDELYLHRDLLFIAGVMSRFGHNAFKARKHQDGSFYDGRFLAGCYLSGGVVLTVKDGRGIPFAVNPSDLDGAQITYHLPNSLWELCVGTPLEYAPPWDGHTPDDVCQRLEMHLKRL